MQLRNQLNRRNVATNPDGRFNASIDFLELVIESHAIAAGMHFFGLSEVSDEPKFNGIPSNLIKASTGDQWSFLATIVGHLIDRYVIVQRFTDLQPTTSLPRPLSDPFHSALQQNPHASRVIFEHAYTSTCSPPVTLKRRRFPEWMRTKDDIPHASQAVHDTAPDEVFNYACAVLNDGCLLLEFRDAIHEGDGERILRCWKFLLLYFRYSGHTKYALEALNLMAKVNGMTSPRIKQQLLWSRVVNSKGCPRANIPIDLHMEHLNRTLKDIMHGLGANISEKAIVNASQSLHGLVSLGNSYDKQLEINQASMHHTKKSCEKDRDVVIKQLASNSKVFHYTPGRRHRGYQEISPNITQRIKVDALFKWVRVHQKKLANEQRFKRLFQ